MKQKKYQSQFTGDEIDEQIKYVKKDLKNIIANIYKSLGERVLKDEMDALIKEATFTKEFLVADWVNNTIQITYDEHHTSIPTPSLFRLINGLYEEVIGGITIDSDKTVIIQSDLPFDGRVVVK